MKANFGNVTTQARHVTKRTRTSVYKMKVVDKMLANDELMNLLYYNTADAASRPPISEEQRRAFAKTNIHHWKFNPEKVEEMTTFVGVDMGTFQGASHQTVNGLIHFFVYTHRDIMPTNFGSRQDEIKDILIEIFDKDITIGMGEFHFMTATPLYTHMNIWGGHVITFELVDLR